MYEQCPGFCILKPDTSVSKVNFIKRRQRCGHTQMKTGINYTNRHNFLYDSFTLDDWLTVHRSITLVDFQLDAQKHIIYLLNSSTCFEHYPAHLQEVQVVIVYMQPLVSSLSAGDCLVHRLRKKFFLNRCTGQSPAESDNTRGCIYTITT